MHDTVLQFQAGADSWRHVKKWDALLQDDTMADEEYAAIQPLIMQSLTKHYHTIDETGTIEPFDEANYNTDVLAMRNLFAAIRRRADGNTIFHPSADIRDRINTEFKRVPWAKGKPPEISTAWYATPPLPLIIMHYQCIMYALFVVCVPHRFVIMHYQCIINALFMHMRYTRG